MDIAKKNDTRPNLKTKGFSTLHIEIFEQILISGKTNRNLNVQFGYTPKSHCIVDHSRKTMHKLLVLENLKKEEFIQELIYPKKYKFWWKRLLEKHKPTLLEKAITPMYYK